MTASKDTPATKKTTPHSATQLVHSGRDPKAQHGIVNPPIYHASTVTFPTVSALNAATKKPLDDVYYGRYGTPTTFAFEEAVAALDGGYERAVATSSGLAAITTALLAYATAGDHILMVDTVYHPTRKFCDETLANLGIETTYYNPSCSASIQTHFKSNTRLVFLESPGSLTFELQDIRAISQLAAEHDVIVMLDNTWATGLYFQPFEHGVDINIQAATKYIVGHADAMLGIVTTRTEAQFKRIKKTAVKLGNCPAPEACWLGLRGLRSLSARLEQHQTNALLVAKWLQNQPEVERVLYPALPDDPFHALWQRDYAGATGLFGVILNSRTTRAGIAAMLDHMDYFAMGFSWGGYESLILPADIHRTVTPWPAADRTLRLHIGLEHPDDLIQDLAAGLRRLHHSNETT